MEYEKNVPSTLFLFVSQIRFSVLGYTFFDTRVHLFRYCYQKRSIWYQKKINHGELTLLRLEDLQHRLMFLKEESLLGQLSDDDYTKAVDQLLPDDGGAISAWRGG